MIKTTNNKKTIEKIKNHILSYYTKESLKKEVKNLKGWGGVYTDSQALKKMVDGGCFLCYYWEIKEILKDWLENLYNDKLDGESAWNYYREKIALIGAKITK